MAGCALERSLSNARPGIPFTRSTKQPDPPMNLITPLTSSPPMSWRISKPPARNACSSRPASCFQASHGVSGTEVFESLFSREKLGSTALGYGIAIPHGRIKHLKETACAFLRLKTPAEFDAPDRQPVDLVFILLAPAAATDVHLQILGELAAMFSDDGFRGKLRAADDAAELHRLITEWTP
jgi:PTS system nitrogen regulatory IIA component